MNGGDKTIVGVPTETPVAGQLPENLFVSIEVVEGPNLGARYSLTKTHTVLGRGEVDIQLNDPTVSGRHAGLEYVSGEIYIVDLQSSNGTVVNGERVSKAALKNMDEIKLGSTKLFLSIVQDIYGTYADGDPAVAQTAEAAPVDVNAITTPRKAFPNPMLDPGLRVLLFIIQGPETGRKFLVTRQSTVLGRGSGVDFQLKDEAVSRRHCQIAIRDKDFMGIKDLASTNSTFLNGRPISAVQLKHNDVIQVGDTRIRFIVM